MAGGWVVLEPVPRAGTRNHILSAVSAEDWELLEPDLEAVELPAGLTLASRHARTEYVYFPAYGIASVRGHGTSLATEVGMVGREGMAPLAPILGSNRCRDHVVMRVAGAGHRIRADALRDADERSLTLHRLLMQYVDSFMAQISQSAHVNSRCCIEQRLVRWLLLNHDRIDGDELSVTHDLSSLMLGVRRSGVTIVFGKLARENLIAKHRGQIIILDRGGLEALCKGIYDCRSDAEAGVMAAPSAVEQPRP